MQTLPAKMSLPVPQTFVRRRPSTDTAVQSFESEARILGDRLDLSNRDVGRNVHQGNSSLGILSELERVSLDDLELMLTLRDDLTVENINDFARQQIQGQSFFSGAEHPDHDVLALPDRNEM